MEDLKTDSLKTRYAQTLGKSCCILGGRSALGWKLGVGFISSVQFSSSVMFNSLQLRGLQHTRLPCPSPTLRAYSNSCSLNWWCHPIISYSHPLLLLSSIFPSIRVFSNESQLFASGGQSIGASASASVLPVNIQDWFPLGVTGLISLVSKGLSRDFSSTTIQKHQFFGAQPSLWCSSHIHIWLLAKV